MTATVPRTVSRALPRKFYARDAEIVARDLLGKILVRSADGAMRRARIVETEAYVGQHDLASHSSKGQTSRNAAMWGPPGRAYVYFVYGMHWMLNVVTGPGKPRGGEAVLLRAAEPLDGWAIDLSGPARLAKAFRVTRADDHADLLNGPLRIRPGPAPSRIHVERRIGVDYAGDWAHAELRFLDADSPHVSRPRRATSGRGNAQMRQAQRTPRPQRPHAPLG